MEETIERLANEKAALLMLVLQISDYLNEDVSVDSSPTMLMSGCCDDKYLRIRNAVAILMEDATEETKDKVKEELSGRYTVTEN